MKPYLDTNFLLRLFLDSEESAPALNRLEALGRSRTGCPTTWLHRVEYANALQLLLFQSRSGGSPHLAPETAAVAQHDFEAAMLPDGPLRDASVPAADLAKLCLGLSARHSAKHGFRTYDLVHVGSALLLKCDAFWSFDARANKLAGLEGLKTL